MPDHARAFTGAGFPKETTMFEPTDYTDEGLRKWGAEQLLYASTIGVNDDRYGFTSVLAECAYELEAILFNPDPKLGHQQAAILAEIRARRSPVPDELGEAYRESHPEVMSLVKKMLALRNHAESIKKS
jgi:hypothetical protein